MTERLKNLGILLLFLLGTAIFLYPTLSSQWNAYRDRQLLSTYHKQVTQKKPSEMEEVWQKAKAYNARLGIQPVPDAFSFRDGIHDKNYESLLQIENNDIMGYVEVPSIKVTLPIYHYTTDEVLTKGAGHLFGSALPVGGDGTHTVISAHRGLPSAEMFTNLNLVKKGDTFYFRVLNKVLAYKVDQILTVEPDQVTSLSGVMGKDYATLVTCTPYGVNTKRLLVRGHRIAFHYKKYQQAKKAMKLVDKSRMWTEVVCAAFGVVIAIILVFMYSKMTDKKVIKN
ncbi:TPA: class C sortase [Streptococcus pyogenes]|uniref:class C sortase n=1 Tax=Streptococcus pyogenes TaxID=1314 RepID=UPI0010A0F081|nr:class C sortase [Streptococcus pyogenes]VGR15978.1 sortase protein SrtC [Streptococcus pyogenes]VGV46422.1 sortase protein SrtC [Streptococcus pyogenes]VHC09015.1 sortase protein SrtC [Streptococcus pyogenes]VHC81582.1 sortase protein SrtC [Streptococcus pyogenes]VHM16378.1 sortase protein SrtC [Streptococcus pyogenes]